MPPVGDSLLGIASLDELTQADAEGEAGRIFRFVARAVEPHIKRSLDKRRDLLSMPTVDAQDVQEKERLFAEAERELRDLVKKHAQR